VAHVPIYAKLIQWLLHLKNLVANGVVPGEVPPAVLDFDGHNEHKIDTPLNQITDITIPFRLHMYQNYLQ
jgi:hypothetical protein